jgi:hypothetical protein
MRLARREQDRGLLAVPPDIDGDALVLPLVQECSPKASRPSSGSSTRLQALARFIMLTWCRATWR